MRDDPQPAATRVNLDMARTFTNLLAAFALSASCDARAAQLYSIYWLSDPEPCKGLVRTGMLGPRCEKLSALLSGWHKHIHLPEYGTERR